MVGIRSNSGLTYALRYAASVLKSGIGESKHLAYKEYGGRTPVVHSWSTFNRYMGIAKELVRDMKESGINRLDQLRFEHVKEWLERKSEYVSEKTLKVNLCALEKFFDAVGRSDISSELRENFKDFYSQAQASGKALPFSDAQKVIDNLKDSAHKVVAELQYLTGARVGDVKKIEVDRENMTVRIEGSKGGRDREIDFSDRPEKFERVAELKQELNKHLENGSWKEIRESYYSDLKQAVQKAGETYTGSHAFRVTYAVERFEELKSQGYSDKEADQKLTQELGHNRESMSRYYRG